MTLQDYNQTLNQSLIFFSNLAFSFLFTIILSLFTFLLGLAIAKSFVLSINWFFEFLQIEKTLGSLKSYQALTKNRTDLSFSRLVATTFWWVIVLAFLYASLVVAGFNNFSGITSGFISFLPKLIEASIFIVIAIILSVLISSVTSVLTRLSHLPKANFLPKLTTFFILTYSFTQILNIFGISPEFQRYIFISLIAGAALALALGSKDLVADMLKIAKFDKQI